MATSKAQFLTVREAAEAVGVSRQTLYRWFQLGKVPCPKVRRRRDGSQVLGMEEVEEIKRFAAGYEPAHLRINHL